MAMDSSGHRPLLRITAEAERETLLSWSEGFAVIKAGHEIGSVTEVIFGAGGRVSAIAVSLGGKRLGLIPAEAIAEVRPRTRTIAVTRSPDDVTP
jgi:hypothetical protein